jgi:hypothetical protein
MRQTLSSQRVSLAGVLLQQQLAAAAAAAAAAADS